MLDDTHLTQSRVKLEHIGRITITDTTRYTDTVMDINTDDVADVRKSAKITETVIRDYDDLKKSFPSRAEALYGQALEANQELHYALERLDSASPDGLYAPDHLTV